MSQAPHSPSGPDGIRHAGPGGGYGPPGGGYGGPPQGGPPGGGGYGGFGAPPPGGYGGGPPGFGPPGGFPPPGGPMMPGAGGDVNTTLPLVLNIVAALACGAGCFTLCISIAGIIFAVQAGNAMNAGDITTARSKAKTSMLMFIVTAVISVLAGIGFTVFSVLQH